MSLPPLQVKSLKDQLQSLKDSKRYHPSETLDGSDIDDISLSENDDFMNDSDPDFQDSDGPLDDSDDNYGPSSGENNRQNSRALYQQ